MYKFCFSEKLKIWRHVFSFFSDYKSDMGLWTLYLLFGIFAVRGVKIEEELFQYCHVLLRKTERIGGNHPIGNLPSEKMKKMYESFQEIQSSEIIASNLKPYFDSIKNHVIFQGNKLITTAKIYFVRN